MSPSLVGQMSKANSVKLRAKLQAESSNLSTFLSVPQGRLEGLLGFLKVLSSDLLDSDSQSQINLVMLYVRIVVFIQIFLFIASLPFG